MADIKLPFINTISITGRLTADPNLNYTPNGAAVMKFSIANARKYKDSEDNWKEYVSFLPVVVWREKAERLAEILHKGSAVYVEGRLQSRSWEVEGQRRTALEIVAGRVQSLEKIKTSESISEKKQESPPPSEENDLPF